jgi:glutamate synthase domain-containing protein 1
MRSKRFGTAARSMQMAKQVTGLASMCKFLCHSSMIKSNATGHTPRMDELMAVGQVFLPRTDFGAQETCRTIVETEVLRMGYYIYGWRHVPVNVSCLGEKANATRPEIEQLLVSNSKGRRRGDI